MSNLADDLQPSQFLSYNFSGLTINNNNWVGYLFDLDSGTGNWKGAAAIAENTDGSATFWYYDQNQQITQSGSLIFQFTWYAYNNNGAIDSGAPGSTQQGFTSFCETGGHFNGYAAVGLVNTFNNTTTEVYPAISTITINGYPVCRMRLYPVGGRGTQLHLANVWHVVSNANGSYQYNDGTGNGYPLFILQGPPAPPPPNPVLVAISPQSAVAGSTFVLTGTNIVPGDIACLNSTSSPCPTVVNSSTTVTFQVPNTYSPGNYNVFLFDGHYSTNSLQFTVTAPQNAGPPTPPAPPPPVPTPPPAPYVTMITIDQLPSFTVTAGQSTTITATIQYSDGTTQPLTAEGNWDPSDFTWAVVNQDGQGSIGNSTGIFQGVVPGGAIVQVGYIEGGSNAVGGYNYKFSSATTAIIAQPPPVPPPPLQSLTIKPINTSVLVNSTTQFTYYGTNTAGQQTYPPVAWSAATSGSNPGQATIDTNAGLFSALSLPKGLAGKWWAGTSYPNNIPPSHRGDLPQAVTAYTDNVEVAFGTGGVSPLPPAIAAAPCFYARFTGYIIAPQSGQYTIGCTSSDGVNLFVNGNPLILNLQNLQSYSPASGSINLTAGAYTPFIAEWNCSNTSTAGFQLFWIVPGGKQVRIPNSYLQCDGGVNNNTYTITCSALDGSGITASTNISIRGPIQAALPPSGLAGIVVSPASVAISAGSNQQFTALGYDEYGNPFPCNVTWSVNNITGSGVIDPNTGIFTGQIAGNDIIVTATTTDGNNYQAQASVIVTAGPLIRISVTPPSAILEIGNPSVQFIATGYDAYNNVVNLSILTWVAAGGNGTITQGGLFTMGTSGLGKVIARSGKISGSATTNVLALVGGLTIETYPQQPFARIRLRDTVDPPLIVDSRVRGGGLLASAGLSLTDQFWWDLTSWEGDPFQASGTYLVTVIQEAIENSITDPNLVQTLISEALSKFAAPQFFGVVVPYSSLMLTNYPGVGQAQLF